MGGGGWLINAFSLSPYPLETAPLSIVQETRSAPEPTWTDGEQKKKTLRPPRFHYRSPRTAASHYTDNATAACMLICSSKFSSVGGLSFEQHSLRNVVAFTSLVHVIFSRLFCIRVISPTLLCFSSFLRMS